MIDVGYQSPKRTAKDMLLRKAAELVGVGPGEGSFHNPMIQIRKTAFNAVPQRHAIALRRQQVSIQQGGHFQKLVLL